MKSDGVIARPASGDARRRGEPEPSNGADHKRCVIYTRKSSEEGLEQDFNSLHAQREACEAYVQSQRHEGWRLLRGQEYHYDDGGLSGGNMDRAGLRSMLAAIEDGRIDVIVVYKVDRLTRSLADFARIVDVLDRHGVSFVSVTQAFNTTSSMGRLTLNVLLSFAQFEREVTAERIRDKIAASKRKGMWMGGPVPLGYRTENKRLIVDEAEAAIVQRVFETYLRTSSLIKTSDELDEAAITTRKRSRKTAGPTGGVPFKPATISAVLRNPVYIGKVRHKAEIFDGQQDAIITVAQFEAAQAQLDAAPGGNRPKPVDRAGCQNAAGGGDPEEPIAGRLLTGRLFDANGQIMSPTHTNKRGVRFRYYLSAAPAQTKTKTKDGESPKRKPGPHRVPASKLEAAALKAVDQVEAEEELEAKANAASQYIDEPNGTELPMLQMSSRPRRTAATDFQRLAAIERVDVTADGAIFTIASGRNGNLGKSGARTVHVPIDWQRPIRGDIQSPAGVAAQTKAEKLADRQQRANAKLVNAIATAHRRYELIKRGEVRTISELAGRENCSVRGVRLGLNLAWLAPDIVQAAMDGQLDASISATELARALPSDWKAQRQLVGLGA